jgi:hypothetical protein
MDSSDYGSESTTSDASSTSDDSSTSDSSSTYDDSSTSDARAQEVRVDSDFDGWGELPMDLKMRVIALLPVGVSLAVCRLARQDAAARVRGFRAQPVVRLPDLNAMVNLTHIDCSNCPYIMRVSRWHNITGRKASHSRNIYKTLELSCTQKY